MDEFGKCREIECDGTKWGITCVGIAKPGGFTLRCTPKDGREYISIPAPKRLDMMTDQELCDLIESEQSKP